MGRPLTLVVEGATDEAVATRLLLDAGFEPGPVYGKSGKHYLDQRLAGYNSAARFSCWLVLRDLDDDASCAPTLRTQLLATPSARMRLHIVVHAIEAWLMGDADTLSTYLSVGRSKLPSAPESIVDPKRVLVDVARRSRRRSIREALVPAPGTSATVGPGYAATLIEFVATHWRPEVAALRCESLQRLRHRLRAASGRRSC